VNTDVHSEGGIIASLPAFAASTCAKTSVISCADRTDQQGYGGFDEQPLKVSLMHASDEGAVEPDFGKRTTRAVPDER
jgi:hypothetical protein